MDINQLLNVRYYFENRGAIQSLSIDKWNGNTIKRGTSAAAPPARERRQFRGKIYR